jgi:hypothetical protein
MDKIKILILAANPGDNARLALGEEFQRIQDLLKSSELRDQFELRLCPSIRATAIQQEILEYKPDIIHFSGHGDVDGLAFADVNGEKSDWQEKETLGNLFKLCSPHLKAVFLNACHSSEQAEAIVEHVDYVLGMNAAINDKAAISFAKGFYTAIFANIPINFDLAFAAGLNQMEIDHISNEERQKPAIKKRNKSYVPGYKYDVLISFADKDAEWSNELTDYLRKQLKQKLATADGFQLYTDTDFNQLEHAATLLVIASPAYCQQYHAEQAKLAQFAKQKTIFFLEYDICERPEFLKGLSPHKFWLYDEKQGKLPLSGEAYIAKADELVTAIAKRLKELKDQQQHQQRLEQERLQQQENRKTKPDIIQHVDAFVFLNSAPEDLDLTAQILPILDENGIDYILPLKRTVEVSASEIRQDIENNVLNCDAVIILYEQTTPIWVREQLGTLRRLQRKRDNPLKIIAVYKHPQKPDLDLELKNLHIYCCPPDQISGYLSLFVEALA